MGGKAFPGLFVWVPLALPSGVNTGHAGVAYYLVVTMMALLILEKVLVRKS
jgi:hypothetical protein